MYIISYEDIMNKLIVILGCVLCVAVFATGDKKEVLEDLNKCAEKAGASDEDMEKIVAHQTPETKTGLCTMACFMKKYEMMTEENTMNLDGIKTFMKKVMPEHEVPEDLVTAMETCRKELPSEEDECDAAKHIIECVMPTLKKHLMEKKLTE